jgi:hypothetical protein
LGTWARAVRAGLQPLPTRPRMAASAAGTRWRRRLPRTQSLTRPRRPSAAAPSYEDNGDAVNNVVVLSQPTSKGSIDDFGAPDKFLESIGFLFGRQAFSGETLSEGGFAPNRVAAASLLDVSETTDKKGKKYYRYEVLNRSADGDEGGRHQLISASVSGGKLWICKVQIGDKRWIKGASKDAQGAVNSFTVA